VVWNTRSVRQVLDSVRTASNPDPHIWLHVDASQAPLTEKISRAHFGADLLTFDASKVGSMHRSGCLIVHRTIPITPLYRGGGQERELRPGTEDAESIALFAKALADTVQTRETFRTTATQQRVQLVTVLTRIIPNIFINEGRVQAPHILNISLPGRDTDYLVALLDEQGFAISTRSACETDSSEGSRAVAALFGDKERARATLRISWTSKIHSRELMRFARALATAVSFVDSAAEQ
jgi:cysteine desulfurase